MDIKKIVANQSKYIAILNYRLDTVSQAWQKNTKNNCKGLKIKEAPASPW